MSQHNLSSSEQKTIDEITKEYQDFAFAMNHSLGDRTMFLNYLEGLNERLKSTSQKSSEYKEILSSIVIHYLHLLSHSD